MTGAKKQPVNAGPTDLSFEEADRIAAADNLVGFYQITDTNGGAARAEGVPNAFAGAAYRYGH